MPTASERIKSFVDSSLPEHSRHDPDAHLRASALVLLSILTGVLSSFLALMNFFRFESIMSGGVIAIFSLASLITPLVLRASKSIRFASHWLIGGFVFILCFMSVYHGGPVSPSMIGMVLVPILATFIQGRRWGLRWAILGGAWGIGLLVAKYAFGHRFEQILTDAQLEQFNQISLTVAMMTVYLYSAIYEQLKQRIDDQLLEREHELERALQDANKANEAKSKFLANMSHELRTPLNAVIGYSELIREESHELTLEEALPDIAKIEGSAQHLLKLISEILDLSKIEAGKLDLIAETFDVNILLGEVHATLTPMTNAQQNALTVQVDDQIDSMCSDRSRIRQILLNLGSNAAKFTEHGEVSILVSPDLCDSAPGVRFEVRDTGEGIEPDKIESMFEAFNQADNSMRGSRGGTGLGLAITRHLVRMLGGVMHVESALGVGSSFSFVLPLTLQIPLAQENVGEPKTSDRATESS